MKIKPTYYYSTQADVQMSYVKNGVLRNSAKFTGKQQRRSLFFLIKLQAACSFAAKETLAQGFSCKSYEIFKKTTI